MIQLCIDTSSSQLMVVLTIDGSVRAHRTADAARRTLQLLHQFMQQVMEESCLNLASIDNVACVSGPGSFTGLRIGGAAVKALADSLGCPVVSIPTLWMYSLQLPENKPVIAILESVRDEVYYAAIDDGQAITEAASQVKYLSRDQLRAELAASSNQNTYLVYSLRDKSLLPETDFALHEYKQSPELLAKAAMWSPLLTSALEFQIDYHRPSQPELRMSL